MVENVGRKLVLIAALVGTALLLLLLPTFPLQLGLDLAGGMRLVYKLDFELAEQQGLIPEGPGGREEVMQETIAIIRQRVDPQGVLEPVIRKLDEGRIEINLPGVTTLQATDVSAELAEPVAPPGTPEATQPIRISASEEDLKRFPAGGGVLRIGDEKIRYESRVQDELRGIRRGHEGTAPEAHPAGERVQLASDDAIQNRIENLGDLRFHPVMIESDFVALGTDMATEQAKVEAWLAKPENEDIPLTVFNSLPPEEGGPTPGVLWFAMREAEGAEPTPRAERLLPVSQPPPEWTFTGADLAGIGKTTDRIGFPAVGFSMRPEARIRFGDFTEKYVNRRIAIVLNGEIATAPNIEEPLRGESQISGSFTDLEVNNLVTVLRSGSLKIKPVLQHKEVIGATVGFESLGQGLRSGGVAFGLILVYLCLYYRRLGVFASIGLICNMILLGGALIAFQATLTLPGIAGIILTIGMAVDANILIFDRLREEYEKGRKTAQAAKEGFENALSAIVDGNVTTLLAGLILYNVGTGPIRGFAVTLCLGVLTSMFAALVIVKVLVHLQLQRGIDRFNMTRWLADANFKIVDKAKYALTLSGLLILGGLTIFFWLPNERKLGIDFIGGATVKVRTEEPVTVDRVRELVGTIPGEIGKSAEVAALPASEVGPRTYTDFRVTFKTPAGTPGGEEAEVTFQSEIRRGLAPILQKGPIEAEVTPEDGKARANSSLYFTSEHPPADVQRALQGSEFLREVEVRPREDRPNVLIVTASVPPGTTETSVRAQIQELIEGRRDSNGQIYAFAQPLPETSVIGRQVVGELRDSAIRAILLSLFVTVLYIRVRFAEYSYGIAAVIAVMHDVLFTLGAVAFLIWVPWIQVEINLPLIAAFLTLIGYSINDTIIVFDRIRENRRKMRGSLEDIVNLSLNQTFSRTIMTSGTTLATILVVLLFNFGTGNVLEGFAFALVFGIAVGTFSSIYVASPVFIWLEKRAQRTPMRGSEVPVGTVSPTQARTT
jgi:SecD/SecF fusion protein